MHSPLLSWQAKQAYLREPGRAEELKASALLAMRGKDADESVATFVRIRHFGEEATRMFAGPAAGWGLSAETYEKLSVRAVMAPFVKNGNRKRQSHRGCAGKDRAVAKHLSRPSTFDVYFI